MDLLSDILATLRLRGNLYFRTELGAPWGIDVPADRQVARFHVIIHGACWLRVTGDDDPILLETGDLVIVPHGSGHQLYDAPGTPCRSLMDVLAEQPMSEEGLLRYGGTGATTALVCGYFSFDEAVLHPLLASLPRKLHVKSNDTLNVIWLDAALRFISSEAGTGLPGSRAIAERLSEILFIQVIRVYAANAPDRIAFLAALNDAKLSRVLKEVHSRPGHKWTLEAMARAAGLSRSAFADRFTGLLRMPPAHYLKIIRMQQARLALEAGCQSLAQIAKEAGYRSEAAFSTAFKRCYGIAPGAFRRR